METVNINGEKTVTAFVAPLTKDKFVCIANNEPVCKSGDETYFERFYATDSIKKLKGVEVDRFVHLTETGKIDHIELVSKATKMISVLVSKPPKIEREQIKKQARQVFDLVKSMRTQLAA